MQKSIYIILTLLFFTVTTGFTVRQQGCRTDMDFPQDCPMALDSGENHTGCHVDHIALYHIPFFVPGEIRVPEMLPDNTSGKKKAVIHNTNNYIISHGYVTPALFGPYVIRAHAQAQSVICEFLI